MKKNLINYYAVIMLILFVIYNIILNNLKIGGLIYQIFMIVLIIINAIILIIFRKRLKCKGLVILVYFFIWGFSKNALQYFFGISNMLILMITGFMESNSIKVIIVFITTFIGAFSMPILFVYLIFFGASISEESRRNDIYRDMHYYCENNYEVYTYSSGAMDKFHYSIGKYYDFLDIDGIIYISYNERNEVTEEEYDQFLNKQKCRLVSDINGSE